MFELSGIAPAPRGVPQVEVAFDIDANGIVNVSAKDLGTGKQQSVTISGGSALAKDDIERMMADAEKDAEEDRQRREEAEARNRGGSLAYTTEKFLAEHADTVPGDVKSGARSAVTAGESTRSLARYETPGGRLARARRVRHSVGRLRPSRAGTRCPSRAAVLQPGGPQPGTLPPGTPPRAGRRPPAARAAGPRKALPTGRRRALPARDRRPRGKTRPAGSPSAPRARTPRQRGNRTLPSEPAGARVAVGEAGEPDEPDGPAGPGSDIDSDVDRQVSEGGGDDARIPEQADEAPSGDGGADTPHDGAPRAGGTD